MPTDANEEIRGYVVYNQYAFIQLIVIRTFAHSFDELARYLAYMNNSLLSRTVKTVFTYFFPAFDFCRNNKLESKINKKEVLNLRICFEILTASDHLTADNKLLRDGEDVQKASKKLKILSDKLNYEKCVLFIDLRSITYHMDKFDC